MTPPVPYYDHGGITIYHGDCAEIMPHLPAFDLLLTDPPYGVNITKHNRMKSALGSTGDTWDLGIPSAEQIERLKLSAKWQIIWGGNFFPLGPTSNYMVWHKQNDGLRFSEHELAWTNLKSVPRHFALRPQGNMGGGEAKLHPTQKPVALLNWCIQQAPDDVATIFDPYMGSGSTLVAGRSQGKRVVGIEREKKYCKAAVERLAQETLAWA